MVIRQGDQVVRRATFPAPGQQVRHAIRLTNGEYRIDYRVERSSGPVQGEKDITVAEAQTIVLPLLR